MSVATMIHVNKPITEDKLIDFIQKEIREYEGCENAVIKHEYKDGRLHIWTDEGGGGSCWFSINKDGKTLIAETYMGRGPLGFTLQNIGTFRALQILGEGGIIESDSTMPSYEAFDPQRNIWKTVEYEDYDDLKPKITYRRWNGTKNEWELCDPPSDLKEADEKWPYDYLTMHKARKNMSSSKEPKKKIERYGETKIERWVVADERMFEEARKAGLYKSIGSFGPKVIVKLYNSQVSELISLIEKEIKAIVNEWTEQNPAEITAVHKKGFMAASTSQYMNQIEENLYLLEQLLAFDRKKRELECIRYGMPTSYCILHGILFEQLKEVRDIVHFPFEVNRFYEAYKKYEEANSPQCALCKARGANFHIGGMIIHEECAYKYKFKYCRYCGTVYFDEGKTRCENKPGCKNYKLKYYSDIYPKEELPNIPGIKVKMTEEVLEMTEKMAKGPRRKENPDSPIPLH